MGMPSVIISFSQKAATALTRGERGIIGLIVKDTVVPETNPLVCLSSGDIPDGLSETNKEQISLALRGYVNLPKKVIVYVLPSDASDYEEALSYFSSCKFNWLVCPSAQTDGMTDRIVEYVKKERENNHLIKAVLPNTTADSEAIVNFATEKIYVDDTEYDTEEYCSRIAGMIAGTPMSIATTYAEMAEVTDCSKLTKEEMDKAVEAGKFIIFFDGEKVKTARAVTSLTTLIADKGKNFQKIKIMEAMDMIADDIRTTMEDSYIGKYPNTYSNKCLLLAAIGNYFDGLAQDNIIASGTVEIDIQANSDYLKAQGKDVSGMSEDEIKRADTGSYVYLTATVQMLDAIEDIIIPITM
jgi:hypothetical protein